MIQEPYLGCDKSKLLIVTQTSKRPTGRQRGIYLALPAEIFEASYGSTSVMHGQGSMACEVHNFHSDYATICRVQDPQSEVWKPNCHDLRGLPCICGFIGSSDGDGAISGGRCCDGHKESRLRSQI